MKETCHWNNRPRVQDQAARCHAVGYVERSLNPFESYMWHYSELKNTMDALKVMLELNDSAAPVSVR